MKQETPELREEIAKRLRLAREAAGLSQGQVAKRLELHRPTVSEIEAGRRRVSAEEIACFANLFNVDVNWIMNGAKAVEDSDKIVLAARQLSKLKEKDVDRLIELLQMLRGTGGEDASE